MKATIQKVIEENHRVKTFVVELSEPVNFTSGQAMRWQIPGVKIGRLFSIVSPGGEGVRTMEFTAAIVPGGMFTPHMNELKVGDTIELTGPFGKFLFDANDKTDVALIAGGTGISVMHSIVRTIVDKNLPLRVHLLFSILTVDDTIYKDELERLAREHENFTYSLVVTKEHPEWKGRCGFVNAQMFGEDFGDFHQRFYICGPEAFIECVQGILAEKNVPKERIFIDRWSFYKKELKT